MCASKRRGSWVIEMKRLIFFIVLLLFSAFLFGCTQSGGENQPSGSGTSEGGEKPAIVTRQVEDLAADELAKEIPSMDENMTELDGILIGTAG